VNWASNKTGSPPLGVREDGAKNFRTEGLKGLKELTLASLPIAIHFGLKCSQPFKIHETGLKDGTHRLALADCTTSYPMNPRAFPASIEPKPFEAFESFCSKKSLHRPGGEP